MNYSISDYYLINRIKTDIDFSTKCFNLGIIDSRTSPRFKFFDITFCLIGKYIPSQKMDGLIPLDQLNTQGWKYVRRQVERKALESKLPGWIPKAIVKPPTHLDLEKGSHTFFSTTKKLDKFYARSRFRLI